MTSSIRHRLRAAAPRARAAFAAAATALAVAVAPVPGGAEPAATLRVELVMVEATGCVYCARWHADVGTEYPITPEGRVAPLRRLMINDPVPAELSFSSRPVYTPSFILVVDGTEAGRIEGYPGEDFFWGLLGRLLDRAEIGAATATH